MANGEPPDYYHQFGAFPNYLNLNHLCYAPRDPEPQVSRSVDAIKERVEDGYSAIHSSDHYRVMLKDLKVLIRKISLLPDSAASNQNEANDGK